MRAPLSSPPLNTPMLGLVISSSSHPAHNNEEQTFENIQIAHDIPVWSGPCFHGSLSLRLLVPFIPTLNIACYTILCSVPEYFQPDVPKFQAHWLLQHRPARHHDCWCFQPFSQHKAKPDMRSLINYSSSSEKKLLSEPHYSS